MAKIVIDPGHGGSDPGAVGRFLTEASLVLDLGLRVRDGLRGRGVEVRMTRDRDVFHGLDSRVALANAWRADAFVSIHANGWHCPTANGWEIYTSPGITGADYLARDIYESWLALFPQMRLRADWSDGFPDKEARFRVLMKSRMPAVLVETGFITHPVTEEKMRTEQYRVKASRAIVSGVIAWLGVTADVAPV